jgi:hypothetical protein
MGRLVTPRLVTGLVDTQRLVTGRLADRDGAGWQGCSPLHGSKKPNVPPEGAGGCPLAIRWC